MARRTKAEKFDIEVEAALEKALDFDFDDDAMDMKLKTGSNGKEISAGEQTPSEKKRNGSDPRRRAVAEDNLSTDKKNTIELGDIESLEQQIAQATEDLKRISASHALDSSSGTLAAASGKRKHTSIRDDDTAIPPESGHSEINGVHRSVRISGTAETAQQPDFSNLVERSGSDDGSSFWSSLPVTRLSMGKRRPRYLRDPLYWSTTSLSAIWAVGGAAVACKLFSDGSFGGLGSFFSSPQGMLVTAGTIIPILMFWGFSQLARRTRELQQAVHTMTGAALRLLEPEATSKDNVASLGYSIRREVEAMGEGIERTMSRASELEALLQNEVNNLEQAYSENEIRIRSLIVELANEREAVSTHADTVKTKITGAKDQLTQEFHSIANHINATAESFTVTLSETLNARWNELVNEFHMANEGVAQQLSKKFVETVQSFDASRGRFFGELDTRFAQIDQHTEDASKAVAERLGAKMDDFVKIVRERTEDVEERFNMLTGRLANSGKKIIEAVDESVAEIEKRSDDIDLRLRSTADKVLDNFDDKFQKLDDAITDRGNQSLADFGEQVSRLENRAGDLPQIFDNVAEKTIGEFTRQINNVEEQFNQLSGRLGKNGSILTESLTNSLNELEESSEDLNVRLNTVSNRVLDAFESRFNRIDHTFASRTDHSLNEFNSRIERLENQAKDVSSSFDTATALAVQAFEKRLNQVDSSLNQRSTSLIESFIARTRSLEESTDKLNTTLEVHVDRVNEAFQSRTRDIVETLSGGRNDILSIIDETKIRLSHEMEIVGTTIGKLVDERAGGFIHQFIEGREKLSSTLELETSRIIDTVSKQMNALSRHVSEMEGILLQRVTDLDKQALEHTERLDQKTIDFRKTVLNSFDTAREAIETQAKNIDVRADALRNSLTLNSEGLNNVLGEQARVLEERIARIREVIEDSNLSLAEVMDRHVTVFQSSIHANDETLREVFIDHLRKLESQTALLKNAFSDNQESLVQSLDSRIGTFHESLAGMRTAIETVLSDHGSVVSNRAVELQDNITRTLFSVEEKLDQQGRILDKRAHELCDVVDHNNAVLEDSFLRQTAVIDERTKTMQKAIEIGVNNVRNVLEHNAMTLSETLRERISEVSGNLNNETRHVEDIFSSATMRLVDSFVNTANDVDQKLAERAIALSDNVNQAGDRINMGVADIENRLVHAASTLNGEVEKVGNIISQAGMKLSGSVLRAAEDADRTLSNRGSILQQNMRNIESQIHSGIGLIESRMLEAARDVEQRLTEHSFSLKDNIHNVEDIVSTSMNSIEGRISEITQNAARHLTGQTENLHSLTEQLKNAATRTSDSLGTLTGEFRKQLQEVTHAAEERLRSENETFISNFSGRTEETVSAVKSARQEIENSIIQLLERLDASSGSIQVTVDSLRSSVSDVDTQLIDVTSAFKQNIGQLAESFMSSSNGLNDDLQRFTGISQDAIDNVARFSEQFDAHAKLLTEATAILDNSNTMFTEKLETRQEALDTLASGLAAKSTEIAEIMQNCEQVIASVIKSAEDRAWTSTTQIQSSLSDLINEATGKFEGATEEIRKSAEEIREELTRTRADLNRGVSTLPKQTKEYTDAMRKAVMEQVEALKELSGIVEESGRLLDVAQPASGVNGRAVLRQRPQQQVINRQVQASRPVLATAGGNAIMDTVSAVNGADKTIRSSPRPVSAATPKVVQSRGWVSDLLARASKEELDRSAMSNLQTQRTENSTETLNSMSADIVQAIDRNAIIQLWQHYRRGQRNISPNRLYTPGGHRTYEKIKHKYALEGDFRRAVGQYITDFERLLGDVTKNGGNNDTVREYLTSDTGKVYTMLAHVSGRIQ